SRARETLRDPGAAGVPAEGAAGGPGRAGSGLTVGRRRRAEAAPQGAAVGFAVICALLVALVSLAATAGAQDLPIGPPSRQEPAAPEVTAETLEALLQDIEDPERREQLVERLRAQIRLTRGEPETEARPAFVDEVTAFLQAASAEAGRTVARV